MAKQRGSVPDGASAFERRWHHKIGTSTAYRTFVSRGHVVYWTGVQLRTVDTATGELTGKAKAAGGTPWATDEGIWVPTPKGFELRAPETLGVVQTIAVPTPKGTTYVGGVARVHGDSSYRLYRVNAGTVVDGAHVQDFQLQAYDVGAKQQRYLVTVGSTSNPGVKGDCSADAFAIAFRGEAGYKVVVGSTADGGITGTSTRPHCNLDVARGHVVDRAHTEELGALHAGVWQPLGVRGDLQVIGDHVYSIGHRELVRFDDTLAVAARIPISTPPSTVDDHRVPPSSACRAGDVLSVVERRDAYPEGAIDAKPTTRYRLVPRDPATLNELGAEAAFTELFGLHLVGHVGGLYVAKVFNGFIGLSQRA